MSADPLVFAPVDRWSELKTVFKSDWPRSLLGFIILENLDFHLRSGTDYGYKVYCPYGDVNNGIVLLNTKNPYYYDIIIQCPKDDTRDLEEALKTTSIIEWKKCNQFGPILSRNIMDFVNMLHSEKQHMVNPIEIIKADTFVLDKNAPLYDVRLPSSLSFELLSLDVVHLVNETWPHKYPGSEWYFELLINAKLGYGLYKGEELISWAFFREIGVLGHLYTMEKHRRRGYGELVLKLMSNILLESKRHTVAYCTEHNTTAAKLYKKLGFQNLLTTEWCIL